MNQVVKNLRLGVILVISYTKAHWQLFFGGVVLGLALLYGLLRLPPRQQIPVIGLSGNYTLTNLPLEIQDEISFGLTRLLPDGQATPGAAKSWQITDNGKTVTFFLDTSLVWQNGEKFDASSVNYNLKSIALSRPASDQITFTLKEPFAPLLTTVSQPLFKNGLVGLGQWQVDNLSFNGRFLAGITISNKSTNQKKIYKFFLTDQNLATALKLGSVTQARRLHSTFDFANDSHYKISGPLATNLIATLFFNLQNDVLEDKSLRQALTYALPDDFPQGQEALAPVPQGSWVESKSAKKYPQNLTLAQKTLRQNASTSSQLKLIINTTKPLEETARMIAAAWNKIGVATTIDVTDVPSPIFDVFLAYMELPSDPDQYNLWHSTQIGNISHYKSPKVDKLLEEGRRTLDQKERKEIYADFQRAITEDVPAAFLFYPKQYTITRK